MIKILIAMKEGAGAAEAALQGYNFETFAWDEPLEAFIGKRYYDVMVLEAGLAPIPPVKAADPRLDILLVGEGADEIEAIRAGATAYFHKPLDQERLRKSVDDINEFVTMRRETALLEQQLDDKYVFAGVVGKNSQMLDIFNFIRRIAPYYKVVTVTGETGSGKEEIAKALHSVSPVAGKPFIACNCGALVEHLIESEFFGHKKGSFTGAIADKAGIFEAAGEGTVFLDEIGDLPLSFQPHLLRVLQNGDFRRVGSTQPLKARCRVIAATNRDLAAEVRQGRFREDLYFRLTPLTMRVPSLRERKDDIALLSRFLLKKFCLRTGKKIMGISRPTQTLLMGYDWPGNVRELESVIEQAAILTASSFLRQEDLPPYILEYAKKAASSEPMNLDDLIKRHIETVLQQTNGNRTTAAKLLGISRRSLLRRIEKFSASASSAHRLKKAL